MTKSEALNLVRAHAPGADLHEVGHGFFRVVRSGQMLAQGTLHAVMMAAEIPVLVRDENEAQEAAEAAFPPNGAVYHDEDRREFLVGDGVLAREVPPGQPPPTTPLHGLDPIRGSGRSWVEAFAAAGVKVVDSLPQPG